MGQAIKKRNVEPGAEYLNVDLEIRSRSDLTPLVDELSKSLFLLYAGRIRRTFFANFETGGMSLAPEKAIKRLADAVFALPPSARKFWKAAEDRVFDIGVEANSAGPDIFALALQPETLKTIAQLNARLAFTFYPPEERRPPTGGSYTVEVGANTRRRSSPKRSVRAKVRRTTN